MERTKRTWLRVPKAVRKPIVLMIGTIIVTIGAILIPLPGPGWAIVFAGFAVLATEFAVAEKARDWMISFVKQLIIHSKLLLKRHFRRN